MVEDVGTVRLADVGAALRRQWRIVVGVAVLVTVLGGVVGLLLPRSYSTTAVVTVSPVVANPLLTSQPKPEVDIATERAVMQSTEVARRAKQALRSPATPDDLIGRIEVGGPSESQVLEVTARAQTPQGAARTANAFARGYLQARSAQVGQNYTAIRANLDRQIAEATGQLSTAGNGASADAARERLGNLQEQRSTLDGTVIDPGSVVSSASPGTAGASLGAPVYAAGGLVAGLLLGIAAALGYERLGRHVGSGARLATLTDVPVIEQEQAELTPGFLDRVAVRAGLAGGKALVTVALLGVDHVATGRLGAALAYRLANTGFRPVLAHDSGQGPADALVDRSGIDHRADIAVVTTTVTGSLARAVLCAHAADRRVLVVHGRTPVATVTRLLGELEATGAGADAVAVLAAQAAGSVGAMYAAPPAGDGAAVGAPAGQDQAG